MTIWIWSITNFSFQVCSGRERFDGFGCYDVVVQPNGVTWHEAYDHCAAMGKTLLAIETREENDAVEYHLQQVEGKQNCVNTLRAPDLHLLPVS